MFATRADWCLAITHSATGDERPSEVSGAGGTRDQPRDTRDQPRDTRDQPRDTRDQPRDEGWTCQPKRFPWSFQTQVVA